MSLLLVSSLFDRSQELDLFLWSPIIRGPIPFVHWGPRPEPRRAITQIINTSIKWPWDTAKDDFSHRHVRDLIRRKGKNGTETT